MEVRSITAAAEIHSFRVRQTIQTSYRDMPEADNLMTLLTDARRDPPWVMTTHSVDGGPSSVTLIAESGLWSRSGEGWIASELEDLPDDWALNAYREIGDMSLVAPLAAQQVVDAGRVVGSEVIDGVTTTHISVETELMLQLLTANAETVGTSDDSQPLESYINRYDADLWIDPETGFVHREQTVIEYTDERLHGQAVGTGPATFTTLREFYDLNAEVDIAIPTA